MKSSIKRILKFNINNYKNSTKDDLEIYYKLIEDDLNVLKKNKPIINKSSKYKNIQSKLNLSMFLNIIDDAENKLNQINELINEK